MFRPSFLACFCWLALLLAPRLGAGTLVQFRTLLGDIEVELLDQDKPVTVQNFLRYVNSGAYATNNVFFHRCVPKFIVQGGGFGVRRPDSPQQFLAPFSIPPFATITNEFLVGPKVSNAYGTIAMAKLGGAPNSASSQWFFNLANNAANLDAQNGGFTVFGRVVRGTNVLELFNTPDTFGQIMDLGAPYDSLPVTYSGPVWPTYLDLLYVDISVLNVRVTRTAAGDRDIRWKSVNGRPNVVEYTTVFPPVWQTLSRVAGDGQDQKVTDTAASGKARFYRVRIEY